MRQRKACAAGGRGGGSVGDVATGQGSGSGGASRRWVPLAVAALSDPAAAACSGVASSRGWWRITGKGGSRGEIQ